MKKNKSKLNKNQNHKSNRILFLSLLAINIAWLTGLSLLQWQNTERNGIQSLMVLTDKAVANSLIKPAVDIHTGDIYFPETKFKIQHNDQSSSILYYRNDVDGNKSIGITTNQTIKMQSGYAATSMHDLIKNKLSEIGSCTRGITVGYTKADNSENMLEMSEKTLSNGKKVYFSYEKQCSDLSTILDTVKTIDSY